MHLNIRLKLLSSVKITQGSYQLLHNLQGDAHLVNCELEKLNGDTITIIQQNQEII